MKFMMPVFLFLSLVASSQKLPVNANGKIEYGEVVQSDSLSASELLGKAKIFINKTFKSGKETTQLVDENNSVISATGWAPVFMKSLGFNYQLQLWFSVTVQCKEGRYKYTIDRVSIVSPGTARSTTYYLEEEKKTLFSKKQWDSLQEQTDTMIKEFISDLKKSMTKNSVADNW